MEPNIEPQTLAALLGLVTGLVLGLAARIGEFCTFGAIESAYLGQAPRRARLWGIVLGTAILSMFVLDALGHITISTTIYHTIQRNPLASIFGGLLFGYGMAMAGNCGFGALARAGGGDLRSVVVAMVIGISAFIAISGPLAELRIMVFPTQTAHSPQGIAHLLSARTGLAPLWFAGVIALGFFTWALAHKPLRSHKTSIFWGIAAGLSITAAFWGTSHLNHISFDAVPVQGHTFTAPVGRSLMYLMTSSGGGIGFPVGSVFGVVIGAFIGSLFKGHFRWEACDDPKELGRQMFGGFCMGIGGVIAVGCSIGQGVSAFSTLAFSGPVTLLAIICGTVLGLKHLLLRFAPSE